MAQTMYTHMNKCKNNKNKKDHYFELSKYKNTYYV
jgi:hypothetical protein